MKKLFQTKMELYKRGETQNVQCQYFLIDVYSAPPPPHNPPMPTFFLNQFFLNQFWFFLNLDELYILTSFS